LVFKHTVVKDALRRIGGIDMEVKPVIGASKVFRYRNKVNWQVKNDSLGFYKSDSHEYIAIKNCLLISERMQALGQRVLPLLGGLRLSERAQLIIRESAGGELMLVITGLRQKPDTSVLSRLREPGCSVFIEHDAGLKHICGSAHLEEKSQGLIFHIGPWSFHQVNNEQNKKLIEIVKTYLHLEEDGPS
jgi:23S rRNA (uracil1939-C5)-methyltransferase